MEQIAKTGIEFPTKPIFNNNLRENNREIKLVTNFLIVNFNQIDKKVYEYYINFKDTIFNEDDQKKNAIKKLFPELKKIFTPFKLVGNNFYSMKYVEETLEFEITHLEQPIIAVVGNSKHFIDLNKVTTDKKVSRDIICFFENVLKSIINANEKMIRIKDNYYNLKTMKKLDDLTYSLSGFSTSVRCTESGFLLLVNVKTKLLNGLTCYEMIIKLKNEYGNGNDFFKEAEKYFKKLVIMTTYGRPRTYTLKGISFDSTIKNRFIKKNGIGEEISLKKYYELNYPEKKIKHEDQPLLVVEVKFGETTQEIYLIPELCNMTSITEDKPNDFRKNVTKTTKLRPEEKMHQIEDIKKLITNKDPKKKINRQNNVVKEFDAPDKIREDWGLSLKGFKLITGRVLKNPTVEFNDRVTKVVEKNIQYDKILEPNKYHLNRDKWKIIVHEKNKSSVDQLINNLQRCSSRIGISIDFPVVEVISSRSAEGFISEMENMNLNSELKLILIILDRFSDSYYKNIKKYLITRVGTPSQVMKVENLSKNLSYFTNLLVQMIVKMDGQLFKIKFMDNLYTLPTVFIGIQIEKYQANLKKIIITCTYDRNFSKYITDYIFASKEEEITGIISLLKKSFDSFKNIYKIYPKRAFIYRSGVSDDEKKVLYLKEIYEIENFFISFENHSLEFMYIVVNKRNDIKFFENNNNQLNNPPCGTAVDSQITTIGAYEFYLQNQFVNQGCATPTHYHVLRTTMKIPIEAIEEITYHMSYYYWNWPGPIRLPACLKFAETASKFLSISNSGSDRVMEKLIMTPYYI